MPADFTRPPTGQEDESVDQQLSSQKTSLDQTENLVKGLENYGRKERYPGMQLVDQLEPAYSSSSNPSDMDQSSRQQLFGQNPHLDELQHSAKPIEGQTEEEIRAMYYQRGLAEEIKNLSSAGSTGFPTDKADQKIQQQLVNEELAVLLPEKLYEELEDAQKEHRHLSRQPSADSTEFLTGQDQPPCRQDHFEKGQQLEKAVEIQQSEPAISGVPDYKPRSESILSLGSATSMASSDGTVVTVIEHPVLHPEKQFDGSIADDSLPFEHEQNQET
uniref:Uncharacterized protein n=1 Tax=Ditylenchus dipsaci TaxID=166011 RepID=A0A915ERU9_9BILA